MPADGAIYELGESRGGELIQAKGMHYSLSALLADEGEAARFAVYQDVIGLDSEYDYDPVWAKCLELGIAPSFHPRSP